MPEEICFMHTEREESIELYSDKGREYTYQVRIVPKPATF